MERRSSHDSDGAGSDGNGDINSDKHCNEFRNEPEVVDGPSLTGFENEATKDSDEKKQEEGAVDSTKLHAVSISNSTKN